MQLTAGMDSGPVYGQVTIPLDGTETKFDVYDSLSQKGADILFDLLPSIIDGSLQPTPQDESKATYCRLLEKSDAWLALDSLDAAAAERHIRAQLGYPKSKVKIANNEIIITKAHVSPTQKTPLDLLCQDGAYLSIDELIAPSGRTMTSQQFINGYLG